MNPPAYRAEEVHALKNSSLFMDFKEEEFQKILASSERIYAEKGDVLLTEGQFSDALYIIISGTIEVYKSEQGKEKHCLITTLTSGESLGEMRLVKDDLCSLTAVAGTPSVLLKLSIHTLRKKENEGTHSLLLIAIINVLNKRLKIDNQSIVTITGEKKRKVKQLFFSVILIIALITLLAEVGFGFYYLTHTDDFCRVKYDTPTEN